MGPWDARYPPPESEDDGQENLNTSETQATENSAVTIWVPGAKRVEDCRPLLRRSKGKEEEETYYVVERSHGPREARSGQKAERKTLFGNQERPSGDSQSSQELWTKESRRASRWKDVTKACHEPGRHIKERTAEWQQSFNKESRTRDDELVTQTGELKAQTRVDKRTRAALQDCFDAWVQECDEADEIHERKHLGNQQREKQRLQQKNAWQLSKSSTQGQHLEMDWA